MCTFAFLWLNKFCKQMALFCPARLLFPRAMQHYMQTCAASSVARRSPDQGSSPRPHCRHYSTPHYSNVTVERDGPVLLIGISRPEKKNCVNSVTAKELIDAFTAFEKDENMLSGVLYGKGGSFCAGYDLGEVASSDADDKARLRTLLPPYHEGHGPMGPSRMALSKPVVAAVSGYAVAGGLELALLCDLRVAEEDAIFGVFCRRHGVPLIDGGTVRLQRLIGVSRALDLVLTGRPVSADEALQMGLVNRVVPKGKSLEAAVALCKQIGDFPQECLKVDRSSLYYSAYDAKSMEEALEHEYCEGVKVIPTESVLGAKKFIKS